MHLGKFVLVRATQIIITFFIILSLLFILFRVAPGDPASLVIDPQMTPEDVEETRAIFGLDKPLYQQYLIYVKNFIQGEFGSSFYYGKPVLEVIAEKLPNTILLLRESRGGRLSPGGADRCWIPPLPLWGWFLTPYFFPGSPSSWCGFLPIG